MTTGLLESFLYFPEREILATPALVGLQFSDVAMQTDDGERLHGWWTAATSRPLGHVLLCHGNAGNVGDRVVHVALLTRVGFDVLLFDYRGYGSSTGRPSEQGTIRDAHAARDALLRQPGVDPSRVLYLGESLGGAVALALALAHPPAGLVLQSTFTSVRDLARVHYPFPTALIPDAYPSLRRIPELRAPLLVLHGDRDEIVPLAQGEALFAAAPEPKQLRILQGVGHNDLVVRAGGAFAQAIAQWAQTLPAPPCG